jgi:hypothetical protein
MTCSVPQGSVLGPQEFIAYTEDYNPSNDLHSIRHSVYADDTQLTASARITDVPELINQIQSCVLSSFDWFAARRLQPNPSKTEVIWFGTSSNLNKLTGTDLSLQFGADKIEPCTLVRDLGVWLDSELSLKQHISRTVRACFHQLRRLEQTRRVLGQDVIAGLVSSLVFTKLDYCNALFAGLPKSSIAPLQQVQNAAARLVFNLGPRDHVTAALHQLHWLPVEYRIQFKLCVLMFQLHTGHGPSYLMELMQATASLPGRSRLRSASSHRYELPRLNLVFGRRAFSYAGPAAWNALPESIQTLTNINTFKRQLKAHFFARVYA